MPESNLIIRPAIPADGPAVQDFIFSTLRSHGVEPDPTGSEADVVAFGQAGEGPILELVAELDGQVVGSVVISAKPENMARLSKFFVNVAYRGRGLGRALLARAVTEARRRGYYRLELQTRNVYHEAIHLYEVTGWQRGPDPAPRSGADRTYYLFLV